MGGPLSFAKEELVSIAAAQRKAIWFFLWTLVLRAAIGFIPATRTNVVIVAANLALSLALLVLAVYFVILIYRLAKSMKKNGILYAIGMFLPLVNLFVLASLMGQATRALKNGGLRVGIMGCSAAEAAKL